jgi:hypothetical protein
MAAVTLVFPENGDQFEIDCTRSINNNRTANITDYPVQEGVRLSDHRDRNPLIISISGLVSNAHPGRVEGEFDNDATGYHSDFMSRIEEADENNERVTVDLGKRGVYPDMMIESESIVWGPKDGFSIPFEMTFKEVPIAKAEKVKLITKEDRAQMQATGTVVKDSETKRRWQPGRTAGASSTTEASSSLATQTDAAATYPGAADEAWAR